MTDYDRYPHDWQHCAPMHSHFGVADHMDRSLPMAMVYSNRPDARTAPFMRHGRSSLTKEEPEASNSPTRRRISVACGRCRKRKIRCSGDPGDGTGCSNCKSAGMDGSSCQFTRVGSYAPGALQPASDRPLSITTSGHSGLAQSLPILSSSYPMYSRSALTPQFPLSVRQPGYATHWSSYLQDPVVEPYVDLHPPQTTYSPHEPIHGLYSNHPPPPRHHWTPVNNKPGISANGYLDHDLDMKRIGVEPISSSRLRRQASLATEGISALNINALEGPLSASERQLPIPNANRTQSNPTVSVDVNRTILSPLPTSPPPVATVSHSFTYASTGTWAPEQTSSTGSRASVGSSSSSDVITVPVSSTGHTTTTADTSALDYQVPVYVSSGAELSPTSAPYTYGTVRVTTPSQDLHTPSQQDYTFAVDSKPSTAVIDQPSEATLTNGQRYTLLDYPETFNKKQRTITQHASLANLKRTF